MYLNKTLRYIIPFFLMSALTAALLVPSSKAYDAQVYDNLKKSRDALLSQQSELQRAYDDTRKQIDLLNAKLGRIDSYLRQISGALKDVEQAMKYAQ